MLGNAKRGCADLKCKRTSRLSRILKITTLKIFWGIISLDLIIKFKTSCILKLILFNIATTSHSINPRDSKSRKLEFFFSNRDEQ